MPAETVFTLPEAMTIHSALLVTKKYLEENSHKIIKENGRDVYDTVKGNTLSALEKIESMVASAREREGVEDASIKPEAN